MKKVMFAAAAVATLGTSALAGGLAEAIMEPEVVAEAASTSNAGILVPVLALIMMAAVLADSGSGGILD